MEVHGSSAFVTQVRAALDRWVSVDPEAKDLMGSVPSIIEHNDGFKVYTLDNRDVYVSRRVAFWPSTDVSLQRDILATYLAHEGAHAYLRDMDNQDWNTNDGEVLANKYQELIGERLHVPSVYITDPARTLGSGYESFIRDNEGWEKIGGLAAAAWVAVTLGSHMANRK